MNRCSTPTLSQSPLASFFQNPFFNGLGFPFESSAPRRSSLRLAADFYEDENNYFAQVELPGVKKDEVRVTLDRDILTIGYERVGGEGEEAEPVRYNRELRVPESINPEHVNAELVDGVLTVTLAKAEEVKPREISVA